MCGAQNSKVLATTRSKIEAHAMGVSVPYGLQGLAQEESWSLLKNITFGDDIIGVNRTLESIGKKIAEKCGGVPLAIKTLGGLLQHKSEESEWINVLEGDFWKLCEDQESIMPVLKLSYQNLSPQLRQCFAYCSLYPKDWEIEKIELIQLWMAQGYLECSAEKQLVEDVGSQFVKILLMKSFFQDVEMNELGVVSFKMHDLMHDLAAEVAGTDYCCLDNEAKRLVGRPMHVSFEPNAIGLLNSLNTSRLRTLIMLSDNAEEELNGEELYVISNFKYLRSLKLLRSSLHKLSGSIGKLKHIRYLNIWGCRGLGGLSKSISNLVCLQTLIWRADEKVEISRKVVSKLINMRRLDLFNWEVFRDKTPTGFGKLSMRQYKGMIFSNWLSSLTNIVKITLDKCPSLQCLPPLELLPFLKGLTLVFLDELEYIYHEETFPETFFPSLDSLVFSCCGKLRGWCRMGDDINDTNRSHHLSLPPFPRLSHLTIFECQMLTRMPTFPTVDKRLELTFFREETLEATLNIAASECSIDFPPLSMLKSLHLGGYDLDVKKFPKDWFQNLTCVENLNIIWFTSQIFQEIGTWFKDGLNYLPSLQKISVLCCANIEALPDWVCNLSSLQHITVSYCNNLASLPEGMPYLTNLQTLEIIACPLLAEACQTETSATWPKVAHIPNIISN